MSKFWMYSLCVAALLGSFLVEAGYGFAQIDLELRSKKSNGEHWDALGGIPDPVICVFPLEGRTKNKGFCYSSGIGTRAANQLSVKVGALRTAINGAGNCHNRFSCSFGKVPLEAESFYIYVYDQDPGNSDIVAHVRCKGDKCEYRDGHRLKSFSITVTPNINESKKALWEHQGKPKVWENDSDMLEWMLKYSTYGYFKYVGWESVSDCMNETSYLATIKQCYAHEFTKMSLSRVNISPNSLCGEQAFDLLREESFGSSKTIGEELFMSIIKSNSLYSGVGNLGAITKIITSGVVESLNEYQKVRRKEVVKPGITRIPITKLVQQMELQMTGGDCH